MIQSFYSHSNETIGFSHVKRIGQIATKELKSVTSQLKRGNSSCRGNRGRRNRRTGGSVNQRTLREVEQKMIEIGTSVALNDFTIMQCSYHSNRFPCGDI
jgi:hypothetical protein